MRKIKLFVQQWVRETLKEELAKFGDYREGGLTGRIGGHREVHFPIIDDREKISTRIVSDSKNPLVIQRQLWRDALTAKEKIESLGSDEAGLHGDLQMLLSILRGMQKKVERLIAQELGFSA